MAQSNHIRLSRRRQRHSLSRRHRAAALPLLTTAARVIGQGAARFAPAFKQGVAKGMQVLGPAWARAKAGGVNGVIDFIRKASARGAELWAIYDSLKQEGLSLNVISRLDGIIMGISEELAQSGEKMSDAEMTAEIRRQLGPDGIRELAEAMRAARGEKKPPAGDSASASRRAAQRDYGRFIGKTWKLPARPSEGIPGVIVKIFDIEDGFAYGTVPKRFRGPDDYDGLREIPVEDLDLPGVKEYTSNRGAARGRVSEFKGRLHYQFPDAASAEAFTDEVNRRGYGFASAQGPRVSVRTTEPLAFAVSDIARKLRATPVQASRSRRAGFGDINRGRVYRKSQGRLILPRTSYSGDGETFDESATVDRYAPGDKFVIENAAPGTGRQVFTVTRVDDAGLWGYEESNTRRANLKYGATDIDRRSYVLDNPRLAQEFANRAKQLDMSAKVTDRVYVDVLFEPRHHRSLNKLEDKYSPRRVRTTRASWLSSRQASRNKGPSKVKLRQMIEEALENSMRSGHELDHDNEVIAIDLATYDSDIADYVDNNEDSDRALAEIARIVAAFRSKSSRQASRNKGYAEVKLRDVMKLAINNGINNAKTADEAFDIIYDAHSSMIDKLFDKGYSEVGEISQDTLDQIVWDRFEDDEDGTGRRWNDAPFTIPSTRRSIRHKPRKRYPPGYASRATSRVSLRRSSRAAAIGDNQRSSRRLAFDLMKIARFLEEENYEVDLSRGQLRFQDDGQENSIVIKNGYLVQYVDQESVGIFVNADEFIGSYQEV